MSSRTSEITESHPDPILVVEDSDVSRTMLVLLLEKAGYEVVAHHDGDEAMADIIARSFSMLILDQQLPGKMGIELLEADRKYNRNTPAIFVTGHLQLEDAIKVSHLGIAGIFTKPTDPVALLQKVAEITQKGKSEEPAALELETPQYSEASTGTETETQVSHPPLDRVAYPTYHFPAASEKFIELTHRLWKIRDFRNTLLLIGSEGTLYEEIARDVHAASQWASGLFIVYPQIQLDSDTLLGLLAHSLVEEKTFTVLISSINKLDSEGQELLRKAVRFEGVFMPFAHRVRFILTSDSDFTQELEEGAMDESLYFRIGAVTASVPDFEELAEDVLPLARHFLETCPRTGDYKHRLQFKNEAVSWLNTHEYSENFADLKYLITTVVHFATQRDITVELLVNVCQLIEIGSAPTREEIKAAAAAVIAEQSPSADLVAETLSSSAEPMPTEAEKPSVPDSEDNPASEAAPPRQGVASYLPTDLTEAEIEATISGTTTDGKRIQTTQKRTIERKKPGSYDFNKRLSDVLSDDSTNS